MPESRSSFFRSFLPSMLGLSRMAADFPRILPPEQLVWPKIVVSSHPPAAATVFYAHYGDTPAVLARAQVHHLSAFDRR